MELLAKVLRRPQPADDKYSRGVVGFVTGSEAYPGAAILGVTAAIRTGIGMVRYLGPKSVEERLIEVRPEVVFQDGRAQAWVFGSGFDLKNPGEQQGLIEAKLLDEGFAVVDAGALEFADFASAKASCILTPHAGELVRLLARYGELVERAAIESDPKGFAILAARLTGQTTLLKGNVTTIANPNGDCPQTEPANPALATAGSGDVLAGILGALLASNAEALAGGKLSVDEVALAGSYLHAQAGNLAAKDGPVAALDIAESVRIIVGEYFA